MSRGREEVTTPRHQAPVPGPGLLTTDPSPALDLHTDLARRGSRPHFTPRRQPSVKCTQWHNRGSGQALADTADSVAPT